MTPPEEEKQGWRHIRLQQSGKNASGQTHYLSLSGLELYGSVIGVCDELGKAAKEAEQQLRRQRRLMRTHVLKHLVIGKGDLKKTILKIGIYIHSGRGTVGVHIAVQLHTR